MADIATLGVVVTTRGVQESAAQLDKLDASSQKVSKSAATVAPALDKASMSAKQLSAATRQLPMQFTDIFTGLASGQKPLQVLLQQGGQLKDTFGGIGPALRASAGYVAGLVNPITIAAAAAAALGLAWKQGSDEAYAFGRTLALVGPVLDTTTGRLVSMQNELAKLDGVTGKDAAEALNIVAQTGKFTEEQLTLVAEAALNLERATGRSIEKTTADFIKLGKDPVRGIRELSDAIGDGTNVVGFLTRETDRNISSLKEQGREAEALKAAFNAYAGAINTSTPRVVENLNWIGRAWRNIREELGEAADVYRNIGRGPDVAEQVRQLQGRVNYTRDAIARGDSVQTIADLRAMEQRLLRLQQSQLRPKFMDEEPYNEAARRADEQWQMVTLRNLSKQEQLKRDINGAEAAGLAAGKSRAQIEEQIAKIRERYAEKPARGGAAAKRTREMPDFSKTAVEELQAQLKREEDARSRFAALEASYSGPLADAAYRYAQQQKELNELARTGVIDAERLAAAQQDLKDSYDGQVDSIKRQLDPTSQLLDDMRFELSLMTMTNKERMRATALRYADASATDAQRAEIVRLTDEMEKAQQLGAFKDDLGRLFVDVGMDIGNARSALVDFFDTLKRRALQAVADNLLDKIFNQTGNSTQQSGGGTNWGALIQQGISAIFGGGRASGGPVRGGRLYEVGERGPELLQMGGRNFMIPGRDGYVQPNAGGGYRPAPVLNQTFVVQGTLDRTTRDQLARDQGSAASRAISRNG